MKVGLFRVYWRYHTPNAVGLKRLEIIRSVLAEKRDDALRQERRLLLPRVVCVIEDHHGSSRQFEGAATCSDEDAFLKEKGRKLSLERALHAAHFDKPTRARIWQAYFNRKAKA